MTRSKEELMTARINTAVHNVAITFDGVEGTAGRAEIVETSPPHSSARSVELLLSGLPEQIGSKADAALADGHPVDVRVLGVYGSWTVAEAVPDEQPGATAFRLKSAGPIMAGLLPI
jgi:hypothetical protein